MLLRVKCFMVYDKSVGQMSFKRFGWKKMFRPTVSYL